MKGQANALRSMFFILGAVCVIILIVIFIKFYPKQVDFGELKFPISGAEITSKFGKRELFGKEFHNGVDFVGEWHCTVKAAADGEVVKINTEKSTLGNYIILAHSCIYKGKPAQFYTAYGHLSSIEVNLGEKVLLGQTIGIEGGEPQLDDNAGESTGHHLHFELRGSPHGGWANPLKYLTK